MLIGIKMKYSKCNPLRYGWFFRRFQHLFKYTPTEEILNKSFRYIQKTKLKGDYLEFGVYDGTSFISAFHFSKLYDLNDMKFHAFDSFEGLPEPKENDAKIWNKGDCYCSLSNFKENLIQKKVDIERVIITKGWFDKTLIKNDYLINKAAIIMIDCDFYESTIPILKFIKPYLQEGTIIIFDDWYYGGEKKAFLEWLKREPGIKVSEFHKYDWNGMSFIINLNKAKEK